MDLKWRREHTSGIEDWHWNKGTKGLCPKASCCGQPCEGRLCQGRPPTHHPKIVTQSYEEHKWMLADLLTQRQVCMKTVILPPGMSMDDPRLLRAPIVSRNWYWLPRGELPQLPIMPFMTDVRGALVPPCEGPVPGSNARIQVISQHMIPESEKDAEDLVMSKILPFETPAETPAFLRAYEAHHRKAPHHVQLIAPPKQGQIDATFSTRVPDSSSAHASSSQ